MANDAGIIKPYSQEHILNQSFDRTTQLLIVEAGGYDGQTVSRQNSDNLSTQIDYSGGSNPVYIGLASPGTLTSTAKWQITKFTYDTNSNVTAINFANGSSAFDQSYDDRASLSYS